MSPILRRSRFLVVLSLLPLAGACVHPNDPGVAIKALQSDIVFGIKASAPDAIPPLAAPPAFEVNQPVDEGPEFIAPDPTPTTVPRVRTPAPVIPDPCPPALASAFPKEGVTFGVPRVPAAGSYKWKRIVSTPLPAALGSGASVSTSYTRHEITNVSNPVQTPNPLTPNEPTTTFTFDDSVFTPTGSLTTTYQVKNNAPRQVLQGNQNFGGGVAAGTGKSVEGGAADRGVAILKTVLKDTSGKTVSTFAPNPPVLILPLDVVTPSSFDSLGVDPTTGASMAINGDIIGKDRIDACGEIVDGWKIASSQTFTSATGERSVTDTTYFVSTPLGAVG
jgi:hypothetical protein